jgi:hypothetical protein
MPEVRISLESLQPCPFHLSGKFPLALHLQHDATDSQKIFKLGKNDEKYVDIIQRRFSMNTKSWRLVICHIETGIETDIPDEQNYELTIKVRSDEDEDTKKFSAGVEPDKSRERLYGKGLFMREIS